MVDEQAQPLTDDALYAEAIRVCDTVMGVGVPKNFTGTIRSALAEIAEWARDRMAQQAQPLTDDDAREYAEQRAALYVGDRLYVDDVRDEVRLAVKWARDRIAQQAQPDVMVPRTGVRCDDESAHKAHPYYWRDSLGILSNEVTLQCPGVAAPQPESIFVGGPDPTPPFQPEPEAAQ